MIGHVTGIIDPKTKKLIPLGKTAPDFVNSKVKIPDAAWSQLETFVPASYFAVSL